jgi:hypothetical protein
MKKPVLRIVGEGSEEKSRAKAALNPGIQTTLSLWYLNKQLMGQLDGADLHDAVEEQIKAGGSEATLISQAATLNTLFHVLTQRASWNLGEHVQAAEIYLRLALKAQAQCARTLEMLQEMKNPRPVVINQANVAAQQIVQNGLMNVDSRTQSETFGSHQTLAALEPVHRASNGGGEAEGQ